MQLHAESASSRLARGRHRQTEQAAIEFERVLTRISTTFAGAPWHRVYQEVELALKDVLRSNAIDQACIVEVLAGNAGAYLRHVACVPGMPRVGEQLDYAAAFPWAYARTVGRGEAVAFARIEDAPPDARTDAATMRELGVRSLLHVPLRVDGRVRFVLTAGAKRRLLAWPLRTVNRLTALGEIFAHAIARAQAVAEQARAEQEIDELRTHQWHSARVAQTAPLVASLAHELCQPLAAILNNAQAGLRFLNHRDIDVDEIRDILADIVASNKRANEVLGALRAMLRRRGTTRTTFDIADAVGDVLALVRSELMTEQIDVDLSAAPEAYVHADKTQIEQVLLNLVMNSIDAMRALEGARRLNIAVSASDKTGIVVSVKDTGRGIPADRQPKVFEAFWTTKHKGLGVGLSLCRAIVESYGGRIWCEPNVPRGAAFRFSLPCTARAEDGVAM
ncbi:MAG TPA: ATP-binding protein [Burkholderiales bacterium]|nr:ATP-binding protein [Burkholderiales bacterium]